MSRVCSGDSGKGRDSTGDGDSSPRSPRSPFTPTRPTSVSVISELDTIQSEFTPSEEPSSPSPTSVAFAVGGYAFGAGTWASIVSINRMSGEMGGPFACDCMARQCVK